jgi:hypothetical protein
VKEAESSKLEAGSHVAIQETMLDREERTTKYADGAKGEREGTIIFELRWSQPTPVEVLI